MVGRCGVDLGISDGGAESDAVCVNRLHWRRACRTGCCRARRAAWSRTDAKCRCLSAQYVAHGHRRRGRRHRVADHLQTWRKTRAGTFDGELQPRQEAGCWRNGRGVEGNASDAGTLGGGEIDSTAGTHAIRSGNHHGVATI